MLDGYVLAATGSQTIRGLDFKFDPGAPGRDAEWKGMDFLPDHEPAKAGWQDFWPQSGNVPNWDAVAEITIDGHKEWLLVEANAHVGELRSSCAAKSAGGREQIARVFEAAKHALKVAADRD